MPPSGSKTTARSGSGPSRKGTGSFGSTWTRLVLRLPPTQAESYSLYLRSRETYSLARQVGFSSHDGLDAVWLLRKSVYQLFMATLRLEGSLPTSFSETRERITADDALGKLFKDVIDDLDWLDEIVGSFDLVWKPSASAESRYRALTKYLPKLHGKVRKHLDARCRRGGVHLAARRYAAAAAIPAVALVIVLISYRACLRETVVAGETGEPVPDAIGETVPPPSPTVGATAQPTADDPTRCFTGSYFRGSEFVSPVHTRRDCRLDFDWGEGPVDGVDGLDVDGFCIRWEGWVSVTARDNYTFFLTSDDGSRLYLNDELIVDNWGNHAAEERFSEPVTLHEGIDYPLRVDYCDDSGAAMVKLEWSSPNMERTLLPGALIRSRAAADLVVSALEPKEILEDETKCFRGDYFTGVDLGKKVASRRDCRIAFEWDVDKVTGLEDKLPEDEFSVRWTGQLTPPKDGTYTFYLGSDDGSRLYLDDEPLIDMWSDHAFEERRSKPVHLEAGKSYALRLEYYDREGGAAVRLMWKSDTESKRPLSGRYITPPASRAEP